MHINLKICFVLFLNILLSFEIVLSQSGSNDNLPIYENSPFYQNVIERDTTLPYPFEDENDNKPQDLNFSSPLYLGDPENLESTVVYDPETNSYHIYKKIGDHWYRRPSSMSFNEYLNYNLEKSKNEYWFDRSKEEREIYQKKLLPGFSYKRDFLKLILKKGGINIRAQGRSEVTFSANTRTVDDPTIPEGVRKRTHFKLDPRIQFNMEGKLGTPFSFDINYNSEAVFNFDNQFKINYEGKEDDIIKKIDIGNVSMPLPGTLITGAHDLFGIKTELQFGKLFVTNVFSQLRSQTQRTNLSRGVQTREFKIRADEYEENKHFFLSKYFRENYNSALRTIPVINSSVNITKIEVWITNKQSSFQSSRNIIGFIDIGENSNNLHNNQAINAISPNALPANASNNLYNNITNTYSGARELGNTDQVLMTIPFFVQGVDYEKLENARRLNESEYTFHPKLGYISLKRPLLNDEILAVAYEYISNGQLYRVGEFSNDGPDPPKALYLKLIKGSNLSPDFPTWDLMMKNVYFLGIRNFDSQNFLLDIVYKNDVAGAATNYITEGSVQGKPLISLLHLDNLNSQLDPQPDGMFDFIEGITVNSYEGLIIFPVIEPFGAYIENQFENSTIGEKYAFKELYNSKKSNALQISEKNKYSFLGQIRSNQTSGVTSFGASNIPQGSVRVTAGGENLIEDVDYIVDYNSGDVQIINPALLESGNQVQIQLENNALFNEQSKTMLGTHLEYRFNENFNIGGTLMYLQEKANYTKANIGAEPFSNVMWGVNGFFRKDVPILTRLVNKLPYINTEANSYIEIEGEFAQLIPGHNKAIGGRAYLDDFEGSKRIIELRADRLWKLASIPQHQPVLFPEGNLFNNLASGYNRANIAWYLIDPFFYGNSGPSNIDAEELSNHYVRNVRRTEVFPNTDIAFGNTNIARVLNIAYYPTERGPYNFDVDGQQGFSSGLNDDGTLKDPRSRWGGIMRDITVNDFENANVEYIEFWLMDPFINNQNHSGGELYINLGNISEDILRDSRKSFENGIPTGENQVVVDTSSWGIIPKMQSVVDAFDNTAQAQQDLGLDGVSSIDEQSFFSSYLQAIQTTYGTGSQAYQNAFQDPANDDYVYYRDNVYDNNNAGILERYKRITFTENNTISDNSASTFSSAYTNYPDKEDLNNDNTLNENEAYFQYRVRLNPNRMEVGQNFIIDKRNVSVDLRNGQTEDVNWYQFRIPITSHENKFGGISDFSSIRFIRMFLKDFEESVVLRFVRLNLVRNDWRTYNLSLIPGNEGNPLSSSAKFELGAVSIEENNSKQPVNYVQPPNIERINDPNDPNNRFLNEQALSIKVENLEDNDIRATYKYFDKDIRFYKHLTLDVHAEGIDNNLEDDDLTVFIRLGSDFIENYYEYELPLKVTPPGVYNNNSQQDRLTVWPELNQIDFDLNLLIKAKLLRNKTTSSSGGIDYITKFSRTVKELKEDALGSNHENDIISVKGNPSLSDIRTVMIGIRNPNDGSGSESVEVWVNELRLSDFEDENGWAANLRAFTQLADFGSIAFSGNVYTTGFGGINQSVTQRSLEDFYSYNFSGNFDLGKLTPPKLGISIPAHYSVSEETINPKFQAVYDQDVTVEQAMEEEETKQDKDKVERDSRTKSRIKSFNLTNVRIQPQNSKNRMLSLSNLSFTYSFTENKSYNPRIELDLDKYYRGLVSYQYNGSPKNFQPFRNWKLFKGKMFKIIKDINFNYLPSSFSVRSEIFRHYREIKRKNLLRSADIIIPSTYDKDFLWNRYYTFKFPISNNLNFDFTASSFNRIDEPAGMVDKRRDREAYELWKDEVWDNLKDGGRPIHYNHRFSINYKLPIDKLPFLDWTRATLRYTGNYEWNAGPITSDTIVIGNTIANSQVIELSGQLNLTKLYNKFSYLRRINRKFKSRRRQSVNEPQKELSRKKIVRKTLKTLNAKQGVIVMHNLGTFAVNVSLYDENKTQIKGFSIENLTENRIRITVRKQNYQNVTVRISPGKNISTFKPVDKLGDILAYTLMSVRNININYVKTRGTTLPGFLSIPEYLGLKSLSGTTTPGFSFVAGVQDRNFGRQIAEKGFLTKDNILNSPFLMNVSETFDFRMTLKPFRNFTINLDGFRTYNETFEEYFSHNSTTNAFDWGFPNTYGNLSMSFISLKSPFSKIGKSVNYLSKDFEQFLIERKNIAQNFARERYGANYTTQEILDESGAGTGFYNGFGPASQDVIVTAFHKAYGFKSSNKLLPGLSKILPNWKITYDGLTRINFLRKHLKKLTLNHMFRSVYEVGSYRTNLNYRENEINQSIATDINGNFLPKFEADVIVITERFEPLIGLDVTFNNDISAHFEMRKQHNLLLSIMNSQLIETSSSDLIFGASYRINDFEIFLGRGLRSKKFDNDLNFRADLSIRKNNQVYRNLLDETTQLTAGQDVLTLRISADYVFNNRFNFRLFYDRVVNNPYVSRISPTINSNFGITLSYNFKIFEKNIKYF